MDDNDYAITLKSNKKDGQIHAELIVFFNWLNWIIN